MTYVMVFCFILAIVVGYILGAILALYVFKLGDSQRNYRNRKKQHRYFKQVRQNDTRDEQEDTTSQRRTYYRNDDDGDLVQSRMHKNDNLSWGAETYAYEGKDPADYARQNQHLEDEAFQYSHRRDRQEEMSH